MAGIPQRDFTLDPNSRPIAAKKPWGRFTVTGLEADLAYFHARLEFIGEPETINQQAQIETFRFLIQALNQTLERLSRKAGAQS
jgi:hypothetical protein